MRLAIDGVTVEVGAATILNGADIQVETGHFAALVGPNGCGKSTLLRTVYRAWRPTAGTVLVGDEDVWAMSARKSAKRTAVVAQDHGTDLDLSVREVAALGLIPHQGSLSRDSATDRSLVEQALGRVGLLALAGRAYPTLSGGERQRVHIARALVQQSPLVLLDEPTNHLDIRYQIETMQLVRRLGVTSLAALHDLNLAAEYCDRVHVMQAGRIVAAGPPAEVLTSELIGAVFGVRAERFVSPATGKLRLAFSAYAPDGAAAKTPTSP